MSVVGDGFRAVSQAVVLYVIPVGIWYGRREGLRSLPRGGARGR